MNHLESEPAGITLNILFPFFIVNVFDQIKGMFLGSEMEPNQCLPPLQMFTDRDHRI